MECLYRRMHRGELELSPSLLHSLFSIKGGRNPYYYHHDRGTGAKRRAIHDAYDDDDDKVGVVVDEEVVVVVFFSIIIIVDGTETAMLARTLIWAPVQSIT